MSNVQKRVFVGNVLNNQDECFEDLYRRFQTFGETNNDTKGFDVHGTFGYLNIMFFDEQGFQKLKKNFNKVNFKGNMLVVDLAKPDFKKSWESQHEKDLIQNGLIEKRNAKRDWEHYKKLENVQKSWIDHKEVMQGRMRKTPRKKRDLSNITFRIDVNGSLKVYKCYKTKLWGYERHKELGDLVYKFVGNKWRNGFDHIVDRLNYARSKQSIHFNHPTNGSSLTISHDPSSIQTADDEHMSEEEKLKNNNVLTDLLNGFDFNEASNAVDSDEAEEFGFNAKGQKEEEEYYGQYDNNNDNDNEYYGTKGNDYDYNNNNYNEENDYYKNDYNEDDGYYNNNEEPSESHNLDKKQRKSKTYQEEDEVQEEEPIPVFTDKPVNNVVTGTVSNTETLRSLFNPESESQSTGFSLMGGIEEDIAVDQNKPEDTNEAQTRTIMEEISTTSQLKEKNHLFFAHFKSPFLLGQTQLTKISGGGDTDLLNNWDQEFWDNRGTWTREMKNKKRDAMRQLHKKKAKESNHILI
ncbi:similar to Saccharomyces cerevisiae YOL144W NOP8 Nucleolar protein required for 60S ribosomal subunit biogenesis [Maudiozyma saulgeensis]|uniref:Similar to Saccharomyces cerevisiae YOL144W NOP8 Nucleolar protein required for 60S ribosomal subunit biogenesis n=1 Tax=Maudiozyma saulgeensis TaxID=1789683 RepID=A0A1X7R1T2_9SACH|nr:similar to Saccharomyces cerevisiae YOL144W NOP8 Nucleolar protein required for 60S ribosomal subunit biogenesis [Kazachstania saulgeensis]